MSNGAIGSVYVFNATPNAMALLLNNHILSASTPGVQKSSSYQPSPQQVQRNPASGNPGNATFGGENTLIVSFLQGTSQQYPVTISADLQINNDLQLYIFFNEVVLVTPTGAGESSVIMGQALTAEQEKELEQLVATA